MDIARKLQRFCDSGFEGRHVVVVTRSLEEAEDVIDALEDISVLYTQVRVFGFNNVVFVEK